MPKLLPVLLCLAGASAVQAQIRTLDAGRDLNQAVNPTDLVFAYGSGEANGLHLYGIDGFKQTLFRAPIDTPSYVGQSTTLMEEVSIESHLLAADLDGDNRPDAILISGTHGFVWKSDAISTGDPKPSTFELPTTAFTGYTASKPIVADFDGDGSADLLVPPPPATDSSFVDTPSIAESPGWIIFSFATPMAETIPLPTTRPTATTTARSFESSGNPVIVLSADGSSEILSCNGEREITLLETVPFVGLFADLDGMTPPELVDASTLFVDGKFTIRERGDGSWPVIADQSADVPITFGVTLSAIDDFDSDQRQELILHASLYPAFGSYTDVPRPLLLEYDSSNQVRTITLPAFETAVQSLKTLPRPNQTPMLAAFGPSRVFYDLLGNPTSLAGSGYVGTIRTKPIALNTTSDFLPFGSDRPIDAVAGLLNSDTLPDVGIVSEAGRFSSLSTNAADTPIRMSFPTTIPGDSLLLADFNDDQIGDPVVARSQQFGSFQSVPGTDPQQFHSGSFLSASAHNPEGPTRLLATADIDQDGDDDLIAIRPTDEMLGWIETRNSPTLVQFHPIISAGRIYRSGIPGGLGGGILGDNSEEGYEWIGKQQTLVIDIDQDGDPDIITIPSALGFRPALHRNTSVGFSVEPFAGLGESNSFNPFTDSLLPKLFKGSFTNTSNDQEVVIMRSSYDPLYPSTFTFPLQYLVADSPPGEAVALTYAEQAEAVDFDLDGFTDFITSSGPGTDLLGNPTGHTGLYFHRNRGDGTFEEAIALTEAREFISAILSADFDDDGLPDIVTTSKETGIVRLLTQQLLDPFPSFHDWALAHELTDLSPDGDPDRDGIASIIEYVSGTHPGIAGADSELFPQPPSPPTITFPEHPWEYVHAVIHRPRHADTATTIIGYEKSYDLEIWIEFSERPASPSASHPLWETIQWYTENRPSFHRFRIAPAPPAD